MMFSSVWAVVLRHLRVWQRDPNLILAGLSWPLFDIIIWGFLGSWIQQSAGPQFRNYEITALLGILLWQVVARGSITMVSCFTEELWSYNIANIFSLPLRISEWMCSAMLFSLLITSITTIVCMLLISVAYNVSLWQLITTFFFFVPPLLFSSVWLGFTCLQIIVTLGKRGIELSFVIAWFLAPFSGAYYPIEVLPRWGQALSGLFPMSYVFEGLREHLLRGHNPLPQLLKGYMLSSLYAGAALLLFVYWFKRSREKGLSRLTE